MTLFFTQFAHNLTLRRRYPCIPSFQKNTHFFTFLETFAGHQQRLTKHHSSPHKNHHSVQNSPLVEPGAQKNIIAHKTPQKTTLQKPQVKQSVPLTSVNKPAAQNEVKTVDSKAVEGTRQATGRAILLHTANGQGHVVQGKTDYNKAILYIWRYNIQSSSIELWKLIHPKIYKAVLFPVSLENLKKTFVIQGVYRLEKFVIMSNVHRFIPINGLKITPLLIPYPLNPLVESPRGK